MIVLFRIYLVFVMIVSLLGAIYQGDNISSWQVIVAAIFYLSIWIGVVKFCRMGLYSPTNLFLLGLFIVQIQFPIDYAIGRLDSSIMRYWVDLDIVNAAVWTTLIFESIFAFFYTLPFNFRIRRRIVSVKRSVVFGRLLFLMVVAYAVVVDKAYLIGGYGRVDINSGARLIGIAIDIFIFSLLGYHVYVRNVSETFRDFLSSLGLFFWLSLVVYFALILISGDRGPVIYPAIALSLIYVSLNGVISVKRFIIIGIVAAFALNAMSLFRNNDVDKLIDIYKVVSTRSNKESGVLSGSIGNSFSPYTAELATSIRALNVVLAEKSDLEWGYGHFQISQLVTIIPFAKTLYNELLGVDEIRVSSERYVSYLQGYNDSSQGSSLLADAYLDFGFLSVGLIAVLMGVVYRYLDRFVILGGNSVFSNQLYLVIGSYSIYFPRSSFLFCFKLIVLSSFVVLVMLLWSKLRF